MGHLALTLLGPPQVRHADVPLAFRTRKAEALLLYLAMEAGLHSREKLTALLWPESDAARGRAMLRRTLAFLRQALGDDSAPPGAQHLIVERDRLGCRRSPDVSRDLDAISAAEHQLAAGHPAGSAADLLPAGEFLDGFVLGDAPEFDDWAARQRETWHARSEALYDRLSQVQLDGGDSQGAHTTLTRWLALSPLNETATARLIRLYLGAGDRQAAWRAYEAGRARLRQELGLDPAPEVEALAEQIRRGAPPPAAGPRAPRSMPAASPLHVPLIGRGAEFVKLVERFHIAFRGAVAVVLVEGEAGIGKTRLAGEFLGWAAAHQADVLQGRAFETGGRIPYQPLVEALRPRLERENAPADLLSDVWLAELSRMLPDLRDRYPDLILATGDEAGARTRLFEAVARLGAALAERAPLVLFLDDLQWADAASLDLLLYALRRWAAEAVRVLVLLALRAEGPPLDPALATWITALRRDLPLTRLALGPLTPADTRHWVSSLAQPRSAAPRPAGPADPLDPDLARFSTWLFEQTGGQPFYIAETLKTLLDQGVLARRADVDRGAAIQVAPGAGDQAGLRRLIPAGVRDLIREQLDRLPPNAAALLAAGAVLGRDFSFEHACAVADLAEGAALAGLDPLLQRRLWQESRAAPPGLGPYTFNFTHDKIRDVVYAGLSDPRRRSLHRRALAVRRQAAAPPADLAEHALHAGLLAPAFRYSLAAGEAATQVFAVRDAIGYYLQASALIGDLLGASALPGDLAPSDGQRLLAGLGRAYEFANEWTAAAAVYETLLAYGRRQAAPEMTGLALTRLATVAYQGHFDLPRAYGLLQQAQQAAAPGVSPALQIEIGWNLAQLHFYMWHLDAALAHAAEVLPLAEQLGQRDLAARCQNTMAFSEMMLGRDWRQVVERAAATRARFAVLGNRALEADALSMIAIMRVQGGLYAAGIATAQEGVAIAQAAGNPWGHANCAWPLARALAEQGAFTAAHAVARAGVAAARAAGHPPSLVFNLAVLGRIEALLGDMDAALTAHRAAWAIASQLPPHPLVTEWAAAELCADYVERADWAAAAEYAAHVFQVRDYHTVYAGPGRWYETAALVHAGAADQAEADIARYAEQIEQLGYSDRYQVDYRRAAALLAEGRGEAAMALHHIAAAARLATSLGMRGELGPLWAEQARLQAALGQDTAAASRQQAAALQQTLAEQIEDLHLRASYLATTASL